jgi:DNA-binding NtrC family response regulator
VNKILIVEDEAVIRLALKRLLERNGYQVDEASSVEQAEQGFELNAFDLIIADIRLPGAPGTEIIDRCGSVPVLIMTSYSSVRTAVEAMKQGAVDYIAKPFDHDEMLITIKRVLSEQQTSRQNQALKADLQRCYPIGGMIGSCTLMQAVFSRIHKVSPTDTTVLIQGESGTGKELVARAIHEESQRSHAPLITVNCAAIPEGLIESELFGHVKGAFTGATEGRQGMVEAADGGSLFLDEIGELPLPAQSRLLRVLQDGEIRRVGSSKSRLVDIRLIAATNRNLKQLASQSLFREDLYFRLQVMEISLPPLRQRGEDVIELSEHLLTKVCKQLNRSPLAFSPAALEAIRQYHWPGNVRELANAIERAVILADTSTVTPEQLALEPIDDPELGQYMLKGTEFSLDEYFRQFVLENQEKLTETELSSRLGISRKSLWERRKRLGIPRNKVH